LVEPLNGKAFAQKYLKLVVLFGQVGSNEPGLVVRPMKAFHVSEFIQNLRMFFLISRQGWFGCWFRKSIHLKSWGVGK
jgi:hypothetical protein